MKKAFIRGIEYFLPKKIVTNSDLVEQFPEWTAEKVALKVGVSERHITEEETALDLAEEASKRLFVNNNIDLGSIDFVLLCTQSPDYFLPTSACLLQSRLSLSSRCGALDFNLGCSGYVYGLSLAKGLIVSGVAENILLVTAETYSKFIHPMDKGNRTIFGDAASATLVSTSGFAEIKEFALFTDGRGAENLIVKAGGMKQKQTGKISFDEFSNPISDDYLYMNGAEIFNFTLKSVPSLVEETLKENNLEINDINLFVFHQANRYMLEHLRKKMKISPEKFYYFMEKVGNTVSSTIPIALTEAHKEEVLRGDVLLAGFGVGYSWGGVIIKYKNHEQF